MLKIVLNYLLGIRLEMISHYFHMKVEALACILFSTVLFMLFLCIEILETSHFSVFFFVFDPPSFSRQLDILKSIFFKILDYKDSKFGLFISKY